MRISKPSINANNYMDIHSDGSLIIYGSVKSVAMALVEYTLKETVGGAIGLELNKTIKIRCMKNKFYTLEWMRQSDPPPFWEDLKKEYERIWKLKAFM